MWIIIATVLLLYLLGFMFICYLNGEKHHGNPSSSDNNSVSTSNNERGNFPQRHQPHQHRHPFTRYHRYHRLFFNRLVSSNYHSCLAEDDDQQLQQQTASRQGRTANSPLDPSTSALFAYRQQQLRQIHHEINEMSYLLGAGQSQSDQRAPTVPVPILGGSSNLVQPLCSSGSLSRASNYFNRNNLDARYSFVHQLMSSPATGMSTTTNTNTSSVTASARGESAISSANANNNVVSAPGGFIAYQSSGSSLSYSPSGSESCHIVRERQRRLRHIRMELEGLSLQLSNVDDRCGNAWITPPTLHGATTTSSSLLMSVSPSSAETNFGLENNSGDSSSLLYFAGGNSANGNSWLDDNDDDDLPEYESIVCVVDSRQRDGDGGDTPEQMEAESPPPSYSEAVHLYSFGERGERKK